MKTEFRGSFVQNLGFASAKGVSAVKAGVAVVLGRDKSFNHSYQLKVMEEARHPNMLAAKGWAAIIATLMVSSLIANSL